MEATRRRSVTCVFTITTIIYVVLEINFFSVPATSPYLLIFSCQTVDLIIRRKKPAMKSEFPPNWEFVQRDAETDQSSRRQSVL